MTFEPCDAIGFVMPLHGLVAAALAWQPTARSTFIRQELASRSGSVLARSLPPAVQEVVSTKFKKEYPKADIAELWSELKVCFGGSEELALKAVQENPQIINPSYTNPPKLLARSNNGGKTRRVHRA